MTTFTDGLKIAPFTPVIKYTATAPFVQGGLMVLQAIRTQYWG